VGLLKKYLLLVVLVAFIFRIILSLLPAFEYDQNSFRFWSIKLAEHGLSNFYSSDFFTNNPVGFFYLLWIVGSFITHFAPWINSNHQFFDLLLKLPANLADILTGILIFKIILKKLNHQLAVLGFCLYVFNPAIFFNSSIWGQYDGIVALFLLAAFYLLEFRKMPEVAFVFYSLAWTFKPQAIMLLPFIGLFMLIKYSPAKWLTSTITLAVTTILIYFPFSPNNPLAGLISVNLGSTTLYNCTSCFAFNFWGMFGNWKSDLQSFLGIKYLYWAFILYLISLVSIFFFKPFLKRYNSPFFFITAAMSAFAFFSLLTRMHERYLFPFFILFLIGAILLKSRVLLFFYVLVSLIYSLNLYVPYTYYNKQLNISLILSSDLSGYTQQFSILSFLVFLALLSYYLKILKRHN